MIKEVSFTPFKPRFTVFYYPRLESIGISSIFECVCVNCKIVDYTGNPAMLSDIFPGKLRVYNFYSYNLFKKHLPVYEKRNLYFTGIGRSSTRQCCE